ncbi:TlpA family protein disulfide reductase [Sphingopyxis indica]|uniref:TlpA family protein disulfide reductase n=1 Tax=Sphingopyxis indica TaxID=436663 RepID=UPI002938E2E6|nr:TlpA disulfide reductase family protein [Sphingopyxis indica]WOF44161.1 TlpA family protein disulfide reductase [Sphingopyxis indica]
MLLLSGEFAIRRVPDPKYALIALLLAGAVAGCDREKPQAEQADARQANVSQGEAKRGIESFEHKLDRSHAGEAAPSATFRGPDDAPVTLAAFRGRPLLVNLWATWCAPCVAEMPTLDKLAAARRGALTIVPIAQDIQGAEVVDPWFQQAGLSVLQPYLDPENALIDAAAGGLPTSILYDADGKEVWRIIGAIDWQGEEAKKLLAEVAER